MNSGAAVPALYGQLERLAGSTHGDLRLRIPPGYAFARPVSQAPLVVDEIGESAKHFPVVFPEGETVRPIALLGVRLGECAFVDADGGWQADYMPAWLRRYPFTFARGAAADDARLDVMIDRAAPHFSTTDGEPLFQAGEPGSQALKPSAVIERAVAFLSRYQRAADAVPDFFAPLAAHDVLVARALRVRVPSARDRRIGGLCVVDRDRVKALDDVTLAAWTRSGLMEVIHAHWQSLTNFERLANASHH
ncbi:SapC family protein [Salinisphaera sp. T31B1]|uniref:SapC family protein n=1 Tax=Salinisphaera sp. T31B1 TaxID=727963 RepID=UPI00333E4CA7